MDTRPRRDGNHKTIKKGSGLELGLELFQIPSLHAQESLKRSSSPSDSGCCELGAVTVVRSWSSLGVRV